MAGIGAIVYDFERGAGGLGEGERSMPDAGGFEGLARGVSYSMFHGLRCTVYGLGFWVLGSGLGFRV